jgi:hypothetical protein
VRHHKRRPRVDELQGDIKKIKTHTFNGEHNKDEYVEAWFWGIRKYF